MKRLPLCYDDLALFEWMPIPAWLLAPTQARISWANPPALDFWGVSSVEDLHGPVFESALKKEQAQVQAVLNDLENGKVLHELCNLVPTEGAPTAYVSRVGLRLPSGDMASLQLTLAADQVARTAMRGVEAIHHTHLMVSLFSLDGVVLMRNPAAVKAFGSVRADSKADDFAWTFENPEDAQSIRRAISQGTSFATDLRLRTLLGPQWHHINVQKVIDPLSGRTAILLDAIDISTQKRAEKAAEDAQSAEKRFLAAMSHEIRTPLNAVVGFIDLLRTTQLSDLQRQYVDYSQVSARLLLELVGDILDVAKFESGEIEIEQVDFDLEDLLLECLVVTSTRLKGGVELHYKLPELGCLVLGDATRIKQIIMNLLACATRFTEKGRISLTLSVLTPVADSTIDLLIEIEDIGATLADTDLNTLFSPYRQVSTPGIPNTGLGVHLSRSLARLMGGDVTVHSAGSKGTTFCVQVRLKRGPDKSSKYSFIAHRVLLFSHDGETLSAMEQGFVKAGAIVTKLPVTTSLPHLLRALLDASPPPDILLLDTLALSDSIASVANLAKELHPSCKIIALTANNTQSTKDRYDLRLEKPLSFNKLARALRDLIDSSQAAPAKPLHNMQVLVVEDVEANITLAREIFRVHFGIEVDIAHDGAEAISKIQTATYHVVFMDIQMPIMDGLEATRRLRAMGSKIPIVAMTANALSEQIQSAQEIGMDGYITKPVGRAQIEDALRKYCPANLPETPRSLPTPIPVSPQTSRLSLPASGSLRAPALSAAPGPNERILIRDLPAPITSIARNAQLGKDYRASAFAYFCSILDETRADELLQSSIRSVEQLLPQLSEALTNDDPEAARRALHALKGLLLNSGLVDPAESTARAEHELRAGSSLAGLAPAIRTLIDAMKGFVSEEGH